MESTFTFTLTEIMDIFFFLILVASSIGLFIILRGYGGFIGKYFRMIGWGALVFGLSRILEKFLLQFFVDFGYTITVLTHFLEAVSFLLILYGFKLFLNK